MGNEWWVRVKYAHYKDGYVVSLGLDITKHKEVLEDAIEKIRNGEGPIIKHDITFPTRIFDGNGVVEDIGLFILGGEPNSTENKIFVEASELNELFEDIKRFYEKYDELTGATTHLEFVEATDFLEKDAPFRKITIKDRVRELLGREID